MKKNILFLILIFTNPVFCADYYFSQSFGNDLTGNGSESMPWQTIAKINATTFYPGDNIYLKAGDTWTIGNDESGIHFTWNGSPGNPITLASYGNGAKPVITASAQVGDAIRGINAIEVCIRFGTGKGAYAIIDGLDLRAAQDEYCIDAYNDTGGHTIVTNCDMTGSGYTTEGLIRLDGNNNTIINNVLNSNGCPFAIGIEVSGSSTTGDYNTISGNRLINLAAQGGAVRVVHMDRTIIENNWIDGANNNGPPNQDGEYNHWAIVPRDPFNHDLSGGNYNLIRNNLIDLSNTTPSYCNGNENCNLGINTWNSTGADGTVPLKIFNNTFIGNGFGSGMKLQGGGASHDQTIEVRNNIILDFDIAIEVDNNITEPGSVLSSHNNYYSCLFYIKAEAPGTQIIDQGYSQNSNPFLVNTPPLTANDFKIQSGSPCINSGTKDNGDSQIPEKDYRGMNRSAIDIGAYEYIYSLAPVIMMLIQD